MVIATIRLALDFIICRTADLVHAGALKLHARLRLAVRFVGHWSESFHFIIRQTVHRDVLLVPWPDSVGWLPDQISRVS